MSENILKEMEVSISISVRQPYGHSGGGLNVTETFTMESRSFIEVCKMIGQFQELSDKIKAEKLASRRERE